MDLLLISLGQSVCNQKTEEIYVICQDHENEIFLLFVQET